MKSSQVGCLLLLFSALSGLGQDITTLPVPWPPPAKPSDSPFAKMACVSFSSYKKDGVEVNPNWGDMNPNDFGPRDVKFDPTGIKELNQIPDPGVHPRIFCTPADLPDIQRRVKETRCGQSMWKNLLCYTNFMKGTYDAKADYAQLNVIDPTKKVQDSRVPLFRAGFGAHDTALAAARYHALINGDTTTAAGGLWNVFALEAFRCWVEGDAAGGHDLAAAVTTALKIEQAKRDASPNKKTPLEQPVAGIQLGYTYDFLYNYLSPEQRQAIHDELANGTWSHDNYGTFNDATTSRSNWASFTYWLIPTLAIEGEPGFNDLKVRGMYRGWRNLFTYGWYESGATYEGESKTQLGMEGVLAFAIRAKAYGFENLAGHPYLRAYADSFLPKSVIPTRDGFVKYDLLGGCHDKPYPADLIGLKYLLPNDKAIDWVYRSAVGENYENVPKEPCFGTYDPIVWGGYFNSMIPFLVCASDFDPSNDDPSKLGVSNTFFSGERALMMTRSSWDKDALMLNMHVRQANGGHPFADRNSIMVAGAGRVWAPIYGHGYEGWQNVNNSEVVIDDHPQADPDNYSFHPPGRLIDFSDQPLATFAVGDAAYAWAWNWKLDETWGTRGTYTMDDYTNKTINVETEKGWEYEMHSINDFSYVKGTFDYLNAPMAIQPSWIKLKGAICPIVRQPNFPVVKAIRTAGLVRGAHPYALVVDDIQKDDQPHDYTWYMTLEYDIQIAKLEKPNEHEMDLILTGNDPTQANSAGNASSKPEVVPATLDPSASIPTGQPMLLVRFLNYTGTDPDKIQTEAKQPTILEDALPANPKGHYSQRVRRLAVPVHAVSPDFKVLLYAYHQGDPLPTTSWSGKTSVDVTWPDQKDQIDFAADATGKTNVTVSRGSNVLVTMNKPVPPLDAAPK